MIPSYGMENKIPDSLRSCVERRLLHEVYWPVTYFEWGFDEEKFMIFCRSVSEVGPNKAEFHAVLLSPECVKRNAK